MTKVFWSREACLFDELSTGEAFKIDSKKSRGSVYMKIRTGCSRLCLTNEQNQSTEPDVYGQLEIVTGRIFPPTKSKVVPVNVSISIDECKPE